MSKPWFESWFDEDYLALYAHRDEAEAERQIATALAWLGRPSGPVLDLACGQGRHVRALRRHGISAFGLDLSPTLLAAANRAATPGLVRADMRTLPFVGSQFAAVVSYFTSLGYFDDDGDDRRVLAEIARILAPGGKFLFDTFQPGPTVATLVAEEASTCSGRAVRIRRRWNAACRRLEKTIELDGRRLVESVRAYEAEELAAMARASGFARCDFFAEGEGGEIQPLRSNSPRILMLAEVA